jgi:membrane-bound lytic murein transglycosylase B
MSRHLFFSLLMLFGSAQVQGASADVTFGEYLNGLRSEASAAGIDNKTLEQAFSQIKLFRKAYPDEAKPTEEHKSLDTYLPQAVPESKVDLARDLFKAHESELEQIVERYGVQPRFIIALWGMESDFGARAGAYPFLAVAASLAFEGKREAFFRKEFLAALRILARGDIQYGQLVASDEGGMGQFQLWPSLYLDYAQDGDGDGKKDIWNSLHDAFATVAYFLQQQGWNEEETWGRQVSVPKDFAPSLVGLDTMKSFTQWQALGVRRYDGSDLPARDDMQISMVMPDGQRGRKYLVYENYRALRQWNASDYFALTVTHLSERIKYPPLN